MGNFQNYTICCCLFDSYQDDKIKKLQNQFLRKYQDTIFYNTCVNFISDIRNHHIKFNKNCQVFQLKQSLLQSLAGQDKGNNKNYDFNDKLSTISNNENSDLTNSKHEQKLPQRLSNLDEDQKKQLISDLIRKSFIFMDISDIFNQQQCKAYEWHVKRKVLQKDQSMASDLLDASFDGLATSLGQFDTMTIYKLQTYVKMCEQLKIIFDVQSGSVFSKLLLHLKSKLIQQYKSTSVQPINQLFSNIRMVIRILQQTIDIIFGLRVYHSDQSDKTINNITNSLQSSKQHTSSFTPSNHIQFLNQTNLYTFISCLLFDDKIFHTWIMDTIIQKFKNKLILYKANPIITDNNMLSYLLDNKDNVVVQNNIITQLFNTKYQNVNYFQRTIKIFNKLSNKLQPILKLKLLAQLEKQFIKQLQKLCDLKNITKIYDRQLSQNMANWLLNRDKNIGQKNIVSIILSYSFAHQTYRLGAKGSAVLSFIQNVQKILDWQIPTHG